MTPFIYVCIAVLVLFVLVFLRGAEVHKEEDPTFYFLMSLGWIIVVPAMLIISIGYGFYWLGTKAKDKLKSV